MTDATTHLHPKYRRALLVAAALNAAMVVIEGAAGLVTGSAALLGDAADFVEDAAMLSLAIAAIGWGVRARGMAALAQGLTMAAVGLAAIVAIVHRLVVGGAPEAPVVAIVGALALGVNVYCAFRLAPFKRGDSSMRAVWLSARNDAALNILTVLAAGLIVLTRSGWPDVIVGALIAGLNLWAAGGVLFAASGEIRRGALP